MPDWSRPIIALVLLVALLLAVRARRSTLRARRAEAERARLEREVDEAQRALLPKVPSRLGGLSVSIARRTTDGRRKRGDFYDAVSLGHGGVGLLMGEVTGPDPAAAELVPLLRYTLRAHLEIGLEPREALRASEQVARHLEGEFVTAIAAVHDPGTGTLAYAAAGHPPPLVVGPGEHEPVGVCCSPPFGLELPTGVRQTSVPFPAGSMACFYTGGLADALRGYAPISQEELSGIVAAAGGDADAAELLARAQALAQPREDVALCLVRAHAGESLAGKRVEELEVAPDELESSAPERFLRACGVPAEEAAEALAAARVVNPANGLTLRVEIDERGAATVDIAPAHRGPVPQETVTAYSEAPAHAETRPAPTARR